MKGLGNKIARGWRLIKQSLGGAEQDYTTGDMRKAVLLLAIPMIAEMILESVFALVDLYFVGKLTESDRARQVVGLTESIITIIYSLAIGISMAATALVARRIGEKNNEAASKAGMQTILLSSVITIYISVFGVIFAKDILRMMGASEAAIEMGVNYTRIMFGGSIVIMLLFLINGIFRGAGDAGMAMKSLWIANLFNIILCPVLIHGFGPIPAFGLTGAAMATTFGRGIGVVYQLFHLLRHNSILKVKWQQLKPDFELLKQIVRIASPATLQFIVASGSWIVLNALVAQEGETASSGYQIGIRIIIFFILPAWGLSNAAATLVGQNLGALQPERAEKSVMLTAKYNIIFMATVTLALFLTAPLLVGFFEEKPDTKQIAIESMLIISSGYIFYGMGMVMMNAFNGAGDTWTPTIINFFGFWLFQIPLAFFLMKGLGWGSTGVFIAIPVSEAAIAVVAYLIFKKGKWKLKKV